MAWSACTEEPYNQFDFWLGSWTVSTAKGQLAGYNNIHKDLKNCVLTEHYHTAQGFEGKSLNIYDKRNKQWHQTWVDNSSTLLKLDGGLQGANMVLIGKGRNRQGADIIHKITWTPNADGSVRQHWQSSADNHQTWSTVFDGLYTKTNNEFSKTTDNN